MIIDWAKNLRAFLKTAFFLIIVMVGIGSTAFSFLGFFPQYAKYKVISRDVLDALDYIKKNSEQDAVILHNAPPRYWIAQQDHQKLKEGEEGRDSFISALTQRRVVYECAWHMQAGQFAGDLEQREKDVRLFFDTTNKNAALRILEKYKVDYVWVEQGQRLNFEKSGILEMVFSNPKIQIYKRIEL